MPTLSGERETKRLKLPSSKKGDEAWAEIYTSPVGGDIISISMYAPDRGKMVIGAVLAAIKDWNFVDKDGKKAEINIDNVKRLDVADLFLISQESGMIEKYTEISKMDVVKKNS